MRARSSMHLQAMFAMGLAAFLWGTPPQKPTPKDSRCPVPQGVVSEDADMAGVGSVVRPVDGEGTDEPTSRDTGSTTRDTPVAGR